MQATVTNIIERLTKATEALSIGESPKELYQPIEYIMGLGGKRTRPLLTLLSYNLFSDDLTIAYKPALAVEIFHNFTLMHDDIMDHAPLRRGNQTVHEKWNKNVAILSGDVMLIKAYELFMELKGDTLISTLNAFNKCAAEVCEGQQFDMNFESQQEVSEQDYLNMIRLKTSALLGFSLELGGILANTTDKNKALLKELGINMGMSFQLMDDLLDVYGDHEKFGKQVGGDIAENKKTILTIKAFEKAKGKDLELLKKHFSTKSENNAVKIKEVTGIYDRLDLKSEIEAMINQYYEKSKVNLLHLDASFTKKLLIRKLAQDLLSREN